MAMHLSAWTGVEAVGLLLSVAAAVGLAVFAFGGRHNDWWTVASFVGIFIGLFVFLFGLFAK